MSTLSRAAVAVVAVVATEAGAARSLQLVERRRRWRRWLGDRHTPALETPLLWPIELGIVAATVKPPLRTPRPVRLAIARDLVTGRCGTVDVRIGDPEAVALHGWRLVEATSVDDREWREFGREALILRHRPTEIRDLEVVERQRVHLPYDVVRMGDELLLVDRLTGRVEATDELPATRSG